MKNVFAVIAILATLLISVACGSNQPELSSLIVNPTNKTVAEKKPEPPKLTTMEIEARERAAEIAALRRTAENLTAKPSLQEKITKPGPCELRDRLYDATALLKRMKYLHASAAQIGITGADARTIAVEAAKQWLAFMKESAAGKPDLRIAGCRIGEDMPKDNAFEACKEIVLVLDMLDMAPREIGLTEAQLRQIQLKATRMEVASWRENPDNWNSRYHILEASRFGFSPMELGLSYQEYEELMSN